MKKGIFILISFFLIGAVGLAQVAPQDEYMARSYDDARLVRVKYAAGESYVKRHYEEGYEEAVTNLPVFDRDLVGTTDGRMELYLGRLNYLRLDYDSEVEFSRAPQLGRTGSRVRIIRGGIYLLVHNLDRRSDIEIQTPDCGVFLLGKGRYRINVSPEYGSEIVVYKGYADVNGGRDGMDLGSGQRIVFFDGQIMQPADSYRGYRDRRGDAGYRDRRDGYGYDGYRDIEDDFVQWNYERDRMVARYSNYRSRYLGSGFGGYEYELSQAGRWLYDRNYRTNIWIPRNVSRGWRPYSNGRWIYNPSYGYVWTSYDPWGWHTHYYGRWHWSPSYGWAWIPGRKWGPAWVSWCRTDHYYGWAPLSHWNRPVIIINNRWDRGYRYRGGFPIGASSVMVVQRGNLWSPHINRVLVAPKQRAGIKAPMFQFMGRRPQHRPKYQHLSVVNAKGKTVRYKQSGFVSSKHYAVVSKGSGKQGVKHGTVYRYSVGKSKTVHHKRINRYSGTTVRHQKTTVKYGRKQRTVYKTQPRRKQRPATGATIYKTQTKKTPKTHVTPRKQVKKTPKTHVTPKTKQRHATTPPRTRQKTQVTHTKKTQQTQTRKKTSTTKKTTKKTTTKSSKKTTKKKKDDNKKKKKKKKEKKR